MWPAGRGVPGAPPPPPWHGGPSTRRRGSGSPALAPRTWPHPSPLGRERPGEGKDGEGVEDKGRRAQPSFHQLGKEGKEPSGGKAALARKSFASGAARDRWRRGPENSQLRDAPRPGQLEEQLCVLCGGVRIFALAFGGLASCHARGRGFDRCIEGFLPP